jgi:hypothetical protein
MRYEIDFSGLLFWRVGFLFAFSGFHEHIRSNEEESKSRYAFNIIIRQRYARLAPGYQKSIDSQDNSEHQDKQSHYDIIPMEYFRK